MAVISTHADERRALLDAVAARTRVQEGRAWVAGLPVTTENVRRIRTLVAEVEPEVVAATRARYPFLADRR